MSAAWRAAAAVLGAALIGALTLPAPAAAHVTVDPASAVQGGFARIAFRVPTESDTASTTKLEVYPPENAPVAALATMAVPGWTATVQRRKLDKPIEVHGTPVEEVVSVITWTAGAGAEIKPGQFLEFPVSLGPLPTVDKMVFKALQTYSDGTIVRWIDEPGADGKEPESPAPVLALVPAPASSATVSAVGPADDGDDALPLGLAIAALVAGLGGLALGGLAFARGRRSAG